MLINYDKPIDPFIPTDEQLSIVEKTLKKFGYKSVFRNMYGCIFYDKYGSQGFRFNSQHNKFHQYHKIIKIHLLAINSENVPLIVDLTSGHYKDLEIDRDYDKMKVDYRKIRVETLPTLEEVDDMKKITDLWGM